MKKAFEPGCYADGALGSMYVCERAIAIAEGYGFVPTPCDCEGCKAHGECEFLDEIADEATDYMNDTFQIDGHAWGFDSGDWGLWQVEA